MTCPNCSTQEVQRCTGHCCRRFCVGSIQAQGGLEAARGAYVHGEGSPEDAQVLEMLRDTGEVTTTDPLQGYPLGVPHQVLTCINHDVETGDCRVHATRPSMCSRYPYNGNPCTTPGCTRVVESVCGEPGGEAACKWGRLYAGYLDRDAPPDPREGLTSDAVCFVSNGFLIEVSTREPLAYLGSWMPPEFLGPQVSTDAADPLDTSLGPVAGRGG